MPIDFPSNPTLNQIYSSSTKSWIYGVYGWKAYDVAGTVTNSTVTSVTAAAGQSSFTTPTYTQGKNQITVFQNGVRQNNVTDYAETSSTSITLTTPAVLNDLLVFDVSAYAGNPFLVGVPTIVDDTLTNATRYPLFTGSTGGALSVINTDSTTFTFNPATGTLSTTIFSGSGSGLTGTAASLTAGNATNAVNANNTTYWGTLPLPTAGAVPGINNIPRTDANGYLFLNYINSNTASAENPTVGNIIVTNDTDNAYYRKSTPSNLYTGSWSAWYAGQVTAGALGTYAYLGYGAASTVAITAGTNQAGSGLRYWGSAGAVGATQVSTAAVGATPAGTWKPVGTVTQVTSLVKHSVWVRVA